MKALLLETEKNSRIGHLTGKSKGYKDLRLFDIKLPSMFDGKNYHMVIIEESDVIIEKGDWYYTDTIDQVFHAYCDSLVEGANSSTHCHKILFTTDDEIDLESISDDSITILVDYYNTHDKMPEKININSAGKIDIFPNDIILNKYDKMWILLCKGHLKEKYPNTGKWVDTLKPLFTEIYGWSPDEDNNYIDYLNGMFTKLLEIQLKIQDDKSGHERQLKSIFFDSFSKGISNDSELPIERAIHTLCGLLQNNRVIKEDGSARYNLEL